MCKNNLFEILGIQSREDSVSNALAYAFDHSRHFQTRFLARICGKNPEVYIKAKAHTRVSVSGAGIPDIVLLCESPQGHDLIIIENKLGADEGDDQTIRYASEETISGVEKALNLSHTANPSFVFLALFPDQKPKCTEFVPQYHRALVEVYGQGLPEDALADQIMRDWIALLEEFYANEKYSPDDNLIKKIASDSALEQGYPYFRSLMAGLNLPAGLQIEHIGKYSNPGRRYYLALISKHDWHPFSTAKAEDCTVVDPSNAFNIHFEPQFHVLDKSLKIYLHYELNPYRTKKQAEILPRSWLSAFNESRSRFLQNLQVLQIPNWKLTNHYNQIGCMDIDFRNGSSGQALRKIESGLQTMSHAIDSVLSDLHLIASEQTANG